MGIGDSIGKAARNAMEDLGGLSKPTDDGHVPDPGDPEEGIKVHSSISEGSNAAAPPADEPHGTGQASRQVKDGTDGNIVTGGDTSGGADSGVTGRSGGSTDGSTSDTAEPPRGVPGPGGLPLSDPDELRADPSESGVDPSSGMGRG